ncbi:uncharacterized protein LOC120114368 isoform X1 [Hibiscus syriacus]|uniref:uncharacterized protein LOC120114368 isoform X1 n=2 Tax=Hibiscus syriacus TaxID=106335 RepID=UPI0019232E16|nr:uncharacterized protein LOC120114368 isoform X1 [Hibiscus syriacus]
MGKVVEKKRRKKKGRPSLLDLQKRNLKEQQQSQQDSRRNYSTPTTTLNYDSATATPPRRSTRRHPNHSSGDNDDDGQDNASDEEEEGQDEEEEEEEELVGKKRREKKMKLVLKLPSPQQKSPVNSGSLGSDSNLEDSNVGSTHKKRKINSIGDGSAIADSRKEEKSVSGANLTRNSQGGLLDSGPSTALPDKKLLLFILDRLQKKDTYGVFSEPVDPEELPDYHEVIEHPMDFGTIRKKLASGAYAILEQFEKDVFLICSNAMQYNAPDTIYFRQARSIQELAKKNFDNLRQDSDDNEAEPKVIRRGRPPTKNFKKTPGRPSLEHNASEFSSDATLATGPDNTLCSNHDTRKGPLASDNSNIADSSGRFYGSRNDVYSGLFTENKSNRNDEGTGYMMKHGKRHFVLDENRRNTYNLFHSSAAREASVLNTFAGERKQLLTVGVYLEHGYTRSLARFAANLGSVAWKIASKRIEKCLPDGVNFGPGWVVENDIPAQRPLQLPSFSLPPGQQTSSLLCSVDQNSCSLTESYAPETREDKQPAKPKADNLSEKHVPSVQSVSGGNLSKPIAASGTTSATFSTAKRSPESWNPKTEASDGSPNNGFNMTNSSAGVVQPRPPFPVHPGMNEYNNGAYGYNLPAHMVKHIGTAKPPGFSFQTSQTVSRTATNFAHPATANSNSNSNDPKLTENSCTNNLSCPPNSGRETEATPRSMIHRQPLWEESSPHQKPVSRLSPKQRPDSVPPDLNIRFQSPGSPSSTRADSAHPDLALQL